MPAPPGNANAFKHGFYARRFSIKEKHRLEKGDDNLESEINALRIVADRILERLDAQGLTTETTDKIDDDTLKAVGILTEVMKTISTLARSHQLITGKYLPVETAIMDALAELNAEDGI